MSWAEVDGMGATGGHRRLLCLDGGRAVLDSGQRHFDGPPYLGSVRSVLHMCHFHLGDEPRRATLFA